MWNLVSCDALSKTHRNLWENLSQTAGICGKLTHSPDGVAPSAHHKIAAKDDVTGRHPGRNTNTSCLAPHGIMGQADASTRCLPRPLSLLVLFECWCPDMAQVQAVYKCHWVLVPPENKMALMALHEGWAMEPRRPTPETKHRKQGCWGPKA